MAKLIIKNIGPIKNIEVNLNKINLFIGPQSSGKSTIAKIISYCTWVEKDVMTSQSIDNYIKDKTFFRKHIEDFHKMKGYFKPSSYIYYRSNVIDIKWENEECKITWVDKYAYERSKISYIPAERNIVILPEAQKVEFGNTNIRSFLFDWFNARENYPKEGKKPILNLNVDYYYVNNGMTKEDHISTTNNSTDDEYDILLFNASSGLQSITPLVIMIDYLSSPAFYGKQVEVSFDQKKKNDFASFSLALDLIYSPYFNYEEIPSLEKFKEDVNLFSSKLGQKEPRAIQLSENYDKVLKNYQMTQNLQLIIEEPEQNLFPETQKEFINYLLQNCLSQEQNRITITTHSPYILYALNNCIMGWLVKDNIPKEIAQTLDSYKSWIDPKYVSAWQIRNGEVFSIQEKSTNSIGKHYFNEIMNHTLDEYYTMLNYFVPQRP